ncbi:EAL domain-containing protein [Demequina lutea]|uniref:EAL domain-containing protein (Putative c-di-GMP-specific phosphodiesterase class I)/FixJ family two-component response regulator n=1 Tax=Demequina lutea TaxID=431489 RepID=A0A7Y9Z809_9MICO|nr:EAL domain-containing protein [Demequina lutea]NYI40489.1 EAL domain-containing protein (putative c-di-GMP-specific phosphodiesterase class I)/FixJ family two-component response regulator [Demequina lutea]
MSRSSTLSRALARTADSRVLVVDDNPSNTALVSQVLRRAGLLEVIEAQDPTAVAGLLVTHDPDLVLLDLRMPVMDGYQVLQVVQRYAGDTYLPVVVITADDSHESVERALAMGAHDFVRKPFDTVELVLRVRNLLATRSAYLEQRRNRAWLKARLGLFEPDLADLAGTADDARRAILAVIESDAIRIAVQPVVDMRSGELIGAEALARFPAEPFPHPAAWFAAALEVGLTPELEIACALKALELLPGQPDGSKLGINFSPSTVIDGLPEKLGLVPWERVVIELTEHVPVADYDKLNSALAPLREQGAQVAVDDTGAGFASLRHILDLKPDTIKIDIGITRGVDTDPSRAALVTMLVTFAERTGMHVLAEGVETAAERDTMLKLGVTIGQGYLLGRPELTLG